MEVYAGFLEHTDHHVGRLIDALEDLEILEDTLVYVIVGDNGASAKGRPNGCFNEIIVLNGAGGLETAEFMTSRIDEFGTPQAYNHYAVGWAHAMDTPYQWTKQVASHWGGTRNGTIVHWPERHRGEGRDADAVPPRDRRRGHHPRGRRVPEPTFVNGVQQMPLHGVSMRRRSTTPRRRSRTRRSTSRCSATAASTTRAGRRCTRHSTPWVMAGAAALDEDVWELYDTDDWTQAQRRGGEPEKLAELQRLFLIEAAKYNVLPLDDRRVERFNPDLAGRPQLVRGQPADPLRRHGAADRRTRSW